MAADRQAAPTVRPTTVPAARSFRQLDRHPAGARAVVDRHLLAKQFAERLAQRAREYVGAAARREADEQPDGFIRVR